MPFHGQVEVQTQGNIPNDTQTAVRAPYCCPPECACMNNRQVNNARELHQERWGTDTSAARLLLVENIHDCNKAPDPGPLRGGCVKGEVESIELDDDSALSLSQSES